MYTVNRSIPPNMHAGMTPIYTTQMSQSQIPNGAYYPPPPQQQMQTTTTTTIPTQRFVRVQSPSKQLQPISHSIAPALPMQAHTQTVTQFSSPPPQPAPLPPQNILSHPMEKPIVILNSDLAARFNNRTTEQQQQPQIVDSTDAQLLESLNLKIERLITMENILNSQISQKISSSNAKEVLIGQIRDQRAKLEEIVRLQSIRVEELRSSSQRVRQDLDQTVNIVNETEKEIQNLKYVLIEKDNVVNQWKQRGTDVERLTSDVHLLQQQLNQLQAQNQVLRNNIKLDPSYNYLII